MEQNGLTSVVEDTQAAILSQQLQLNWLARIDVMKHSSAKSL